MFLNRPENSEEIGLHFTREHGVQYGDTGLLSFGNDKRKET